SAASTTARSSSPRHRPPGPRTVLRQRGGNESNSRWSTSPAARTGALHPCSSPAWPEASASELLPKAPAATPTSASTAPATATNPRHYPSSPSNASTRMGSDEGRSEEHTSELQSRENLVCSLLLENKKHA